MEYVLLVMIVLVIALVGRVVRLTRLVYADALTGVGSLHGYKCALRRHSGRDGVLVGYRVLKLDIDRFKEVNDTYGHAVGDRLLRHFGLVLRSAASQVGGRAYRIGGDEFAVIFPDAHDPTREPSIAQSRIAREIEKRFFPSWIQRVGDRRHAVVHVSHASHRDPRIADDLTYRVKEGHHANERDRAKHLEPFVSVYHFTN